MREVSSAARLAVVAVSLTAAAPAFATGGSGGKGDTGGKGGNGPGAPSETSSSTDSSSQTAITDQSEQAFGGASTQYRTLTEQRPLEKPWEVVGTFETHHLWQENYLAQGLGAVQTFNVFDLVAYFYATREDRFSIEFGAFEYFLADSGETGFRTDDISLDYSHVFKLPWQLRLRARAGSTIPISFTSQLASNITSPFVRLRLTRVFGDFTISAGGSGRVFIDRYSSSSALGTTGTNSGSGQPNPQWSASISASVEYQLPFYRAIALGASVVDSYVWFYEVGSCPYDSMCYGAVSDPQYGNGQPVQQSYGGEIYARFALPELGGFKSNIVLALANGDPALGYPNVLNDGIQHPYFFYYDTTEVYAALEGAY